MSDSIKLDLMEVTMKKMSKLLANQQSTINDLELKINQLQNEFANLSKIKSPSSTPTTHPSKSKNKNNNTTNIVKTNTKKVNRPKHTSLSAPNSPIASIANNNNQIIRNNNIRNNNANNNNNNISNNIVNTTPTIKPSFVLYKTPTIRHVIVPSPTSSSPLHSKISSNSTSNPSTPSSHKTSPAMVATHIPHQHNEQALYLTLKPNLSTPILPLQSPKLTNISCSLIYTQTPPPPLLTIQNNRNDLNNFITSPIIIATPTNNVEQVKIKSNNKRNHINLSPFPTFSSTSSLNETTTTSQLNDSITSTSSIESIFSPLEQNNSTNGFNNTNITSVISVIQTNNESGNREES